MGEAERVQSPEMELSTETERNMMSQGDWSWLSFGEESKGLII